MRNLFIFVFLFQTQNLHSKELKPLLPNAIKHILKTASNHSLNKDNISYSIREFGGHNEVSFFGSDREIIPASLSKILTSFYAMKVLGENYQFSTKLESIGKIIEGTLVGNIYLTGGGDPLLSNADLMGLVLSLKEKGIDKVQGHFYYNDQKYPTIKMISEIGLGDQTYNPGVSALSLEYNRFIVWRGGHRYKSMKSTFTPIPTIPYFKVEKVSKNFTPGLRFLFTEDENELWKVSNYIKYKIIEEVPIRKPGKYVSETFRMLAQNMGIKIPESNLIPESEIKKDKEMIHEHYSKPLHVIVKAAMEYSNNLLSELLLLGADYKYYKSPSLNVAAEKMISWFKKNYKEIDFSKTLFKNGSGLDTENRINTRTLSHFIALYAPKKIQTKFFLTFFSISGQSGWLTKRMHDPEMSFKVFAKTGSLDYINNLAGVFFGRSNKPYAFSISIFDYEKREMLNNANSKEINLLRERAKPWNKDVKPLLDDILRYFHRSL
ncbi:MAG: D-alanyl-D-alanine carboxypeptidase/D-alanyl-D-alanine-endopeptidase [Bacteriovoracaceae bacterium]|jgi:serine-type D-Ala-D-Ala carboxypeptidase/endopeptidase (penicillin-binding protein 4)|nr:D-alanyl-D-alanine carboxypeptidase/D-alanyl-D-alanine-endopeptidase [Bacteriovoracaceae bacterium]